MALRIVGHGCQNRPTDARNGMNATELLSLAKGTRAIGRNEESHPIPRSAKATRAFQYLESAVAGTCHSGPSSTASAPVETAARRIRNRGRFRCTVVSLKTECPRSTYEETGRDPRARLKMHQSVREKQLRGCRKKRSEQMQH